MVRKNKDGDVEGVVGNLIFDGIFEDLRICIDYFPKNGDLTLRIEEKPNS